MMTMMTMMNIDKMRSRIRKGLLKNCYGANDNKDGGNRTDMK
jgi:hypothetical protein